MVRFRSCVRSIAVLAALCAAGCTAPARQAPPDVGKSESESANRFVGEPTKPTRATEPGENRAAQRATGSGPAGSEGSESADRQSDTQPPPNCPLDVRGTAVAVVAETDTVTLIFGLDDPFDTAALADLRARVRSLAERYRTLSMASLPGTMTNLLASTSLTSVDDTSSAALSRHALAAPPHRNTVSDFDVNSMAEPTVSAAVQDTPDGARIIITADDSLLLDLVRAHVTQEAHVMTHTGLCPW